jgi:protein dithiol oxidoreductase (disulfide-forming)
MEFANMKRRDFSAQLVGLGLGGVGLSAGLPALAQAQYVEGTDYIRLRQSVPVSVPAGKIEVVEFFQFSCPHCFAFEPLIQPWAKKLPADVVFRQIPMGSPIYQRTFYALELLGKREALQEKIFKAFHNDKVRFTKDEEAIAFVAKAGIDAAKFKEAYESFSVRTKVKQAERTADGYTMETVPAIGIHGRFLSTSAKAGSPERTLVVTDYLIGLARKG